MTSQDDQLIPKISLLEGVPRPFFRESGVGPGVVCQHSNAASSSQWRGLIDLLAPNFHLLAADHYGAGKSPPWPTDHRPRLWDEVQLLQPVFDLAGDPFDLVGHSYGAAVALVAAVAMPHRIRSLTLFEPTLFSLIEAEKPSPNDADGIRNAVNLAGMAADAGDQDLAAQHFIDFWMGAGAWAQTPDVRKDAIRKSVSSDVRKWASALLGELTPISAFSELDVPVLYMVGKSSPASSLGVARLLTHVLPRVDVVEFEGIGHMGPITHTEQVNKVILKFLERR